MIEGGGWIFIIINTNILFVTTLGVRGLEGDMVSTTSSLIGRHKKTKHLYIGHCPKVASTAAPPSPPLNFLKSVRHLMYRTILDNRKVTFV